jgi:hypothetical protein
MTLDEVFLKAAADRFDEVKLAGWGDLLKALSAGFSKGGAGTALTGRLGDALRHGGEAYRALSPEMRRTLTTQAFAVPAGAVLGYNIAGGADEHGHEAGFGKKLLGAGIGALGGVGLGHIAGSAPVSAGLAAWKGPAPGAPTPPTPNLPPKP